MDPQEQHTHSIPAAAKGAGYSRACLEGCDSDGNDDGEASYWVGEEERSQISTVYCSSEPWVSLHSDSDCVVGYLVTLLA